MGSDRALVRWCHFLDKMNVVTNNSKEVLRIISKSPLRTLNDWAAKLLEEVPVSEKRLCNVEDMLDAVSREGA